MLEIKKGSNNFYVGESEDNVLAEMRFVLSNDEYIEIDHTKVKEELNGQGVGKLLLKEIVAWARSENKKFCPSAPMQKLKWKRTKNTTI